VRVGDSGACARSVVSLEGYRVAVFGGEHEPRHPIDNAVHVLDVASARWTRIASSPDHPAPAARQSPSLTPPTHTRHFTVGASPTLPSNRRVCVNRARACHVLRQGWASCGLGGQSSVHVWRTHGRGSGGDDPRYPPSPQLHTHRAWPSPLCACVRAVRAAVIDRPSRRAVVGGEKAIRGSLMRARRAGGRSRPREAPPRAATT
jgi:hypothetical protein